MKLDFLRSVFLTNFGLEPTNDQQRAIDLLSQFVMESDESGLFILRGYAGTGKTSLMSAFVKTLHDFGISTVLMAPTGRAAKVFSQFSGCKALTVHKTIYRQASGPAGSFHVDRNLKSNTFFIVDEASMIPKQSSERSFFGSGCLLSDLVSYVYSGHNCRLVMVGDGGQLPPVGSPMSPALDRAEMECYGNTVYEATLADVVRQASESGVLYNATMLRRQVESSRPGELIQPLMNMGKFADIRRITGAELLEELEQSYDRCGVMDTLVVTRSNRNANIYNNGIRSRIFWREEQLTVGDLVMVVKNNYYYARNIEEMDFIANGDIAEVVRVGRHESLYGFHFINVDLRFCDYDNLEISCKIIRESLTCEGPSFSEAENNLLLKNVMEDYAGMSMKDQYKELRNNEYFNAFQIKFAYAVTCHKSQGGQWRNVFVDQGYITPDMLDREYLRWLYTAVTRATEKVFLVNFKDEFFENQPIERE
ncbi:MAG: AAA family ATPase [Bacteroidales bacterium]|nr:AAA family ATPase [Bacteroidales bacterium]